MSLDHLQQIIKHEKATFQLEEEQFSRKKKLVEALAFEVEDIGAKQVISQMSKAQLEAFIGALEIDLGFGNRPDSKAVMRYDIIYIYN